MTATIRLVNHPPTPAPTAPRSSFHLSAEQIEFFDTHGYLLLKQWINGELLERLQAAGKCWIELGQGLREHGELNGLDAELKQDFNYAKRSNGDVMFRVDYVHNKGQSASLELLGCPQVLAVAESLCGPNFVPTYESMVFKQKGDGEQIPWHQDAVHSRARRIFNFDLYLDTSSVGAGALRVVPKSQTAIHDACAIRDQFGWDPPGVIDVPMEPGDVLLHDVMVLHGSERTQGKAMRRTIYYEFRSAEEIEAHGPWDQTWIEQRLRLIPLALEAHRTHFPQAEQFDWRVSSQHRPVPIGDATVELRIAHQVHTPGSYCSAGNSNA